MLLALRWYSSWCSWAFSGRACTAESPLRCEMPRVPRCLINHDNQWAPRCASISEHDGQRQWGYTVIAKTISKDRR